MSRVLAWCASRCSPTTSARGSSPTPSSRRFASPTSFGTSSRRERCRPRSYRPSRDQGARRPDAAWRLANRLFTVLAVILAVVTLGIFAFAPGSCASMRRLRPREAGARGHDDPHPGALPARGRRGVVAMGILNTYGRFFVPAWLPRFSTSRRSSASSSSTPSSCGSAGRPAWFWPSARWWRRAPVRRPGSSMRRLGFRSISIGPRGTPA